MDNTVFEASSSEGEWEWEWDRQVLMSLSRKRGTGGRDDENSGDEPTASGSRNNRGVKVARLVKANEPVTLNLPEQGTSISQTVAAAIDEDEVQILCVRKPTEKSAASTEELKRQIEHLEQQVQNLKRENALIRSQATCAREGWKRRLLEAVQTEMDCAICSEVVREPETGVCGHIFCSACITRWFNAASSGRRCPTCRACWGMRRLRLRGLQGLVNRIFQFLSEN